MTASDHETEVIVAGGGPVGLTVALGLARRGVRSIVLEKKATLDARSRATLIVPRALEILDALGVLPVFLGEGQPNPSLRILRATDHRIILDFDFGLYAGETAVPFALALSQDRTERLLLDAVRATGLVDVRMDTPLLQFADGPDGVTVEAGSGQTPLRVSGRYLVATDGAHSRVREQLGWRLEGRTYATRAFLADVRVSADCDVPRGWLADPTASSFTLAIRFADGVWRIIESAIPDDVEEPAFAARARVLAGRMFGEGAWRETLWTAAYRKHERRADRYRVGHVVLAGDAAHLNSPAGGQGLNAGMQDAFSLAWRLARLVRGRGEENALLDSYSAERTQSFDRDVVGLTSGIESLETLPAWLRAALFSVVGLVRHTGVPRAVVRRLSMLSPRVGPSALLGDRVPCGRRMPNVLLEGDSRIYSRLGLDGLLLASEPAEPAPGFDYAVAPMPRGLPRPFSGHASLFIRPDHVVAVASASAIAPLAIARALGGEA